MRVFLIMIMCILGLSANSISGDVKKMWLKDVNLTCAQTFVDMRKYPKWIAVLELKNGKKVVFGSVKVMMQHFYENSHKYASKMKAMYVSDYKSGDLIDASEAFYVFGSRIVSIRGDDLIPFAKLSDAQEFSSQNSGHKILKFSGITKRLIDYLR
ncbi:nitrous oxide reductase accessory protein NosL [Campylobacter geochelonis]|uniref:NosL protein n=1 Tax=Campylobacter geochelonis TaxID=1780362 RepID=A0A128EEI1_9BACT|nr:nitrous oxide reductase accessory protein NosL [Campylobacter geochelonis]QKF72157.1 nitrous oxide reductase accessory protein [Campylobacter geochelonis]CZE46613.1 NosL protein [Campylobacter geochelonis]